MCAQTGPASVEQALAMLESAAGFLADVDVAELPAAVLAGELRGMERVDAVLAVPRGRSLAAFDAKDGHVADGQRTVRVWEVNVLGVTKGQAAEYRAVQSLVRDHEPLRAGLREGDTVSKSVALQLARWTRDIPDEFRAEAEQILVAAARAGASLRALAEICAEIKYRTAPPDPDDGKLLDRAVFLDTTLDGAGLLRGDLTPECAAMIQAVLDALSVQAGAGDLRTRPQRYHDALAEAMRRLLASNLLPQRAGQPVKALVHMSFADLCQLDIESKLQEAWIAEYRARWAAHRAAASVSPGDGGAWLEGDAARAVACDAMLIPVVTCDLDPGAVEVLIGLCVHYDRLRSQASAPTDGVGSPDGPEGRADTDQQTDPRPQDGTDGGGSTPDADQAGSAAAVLAMLEHQILAVVLQIVSGPGGVASFLRRNLMGKGLNGPRCRWTSVSPSLSFVPMICATSLPVLVTVRRLVRLIVSSRSRACLHVTCEYA